MSANAAPAIISFSGLPPREEKLFRASAREECGSCYLEMLGGGLEAVYLWGKG